MTMLDDVAKAICRANRETAGFMFVPGYTLDDEVANAWEHFLPEARAALMAIRDPGDALRETSALFEKADWQEVIDHILQSNTEEGK